MLHLGGHGLCRYEVSLVGRAGGGGFATGVARMAEILPEDLKMADELKARCISSSHLGLDAVGEALMALSLGTPWQLGL